MRLLVCSHKESWATEASPSGYATDGGFPLQMRALASLFDEIVVCVPVVECPDHSGEIPLSGPGLRVCPLPLPSGRGVWRKLLLPIWLARALPRLAREMRRANAVHVPIPSDVGTFGIALAHVMRRPLFVRHCGTWDRPRTRAERLWRGYMIRSNGGRRVMMVTGGGVEPPSGNPALEWIFSTTLSADEVKAHATPRHLQPERLRLVTVGRQVEAKGTARVIDALPVLRTSLPNVTLLVIGEGADLDRFRSLAIASGVDDLVTFAGRLDHPGVLRALDQCDLFVFPTTASEGFPKAPLEAMACGLPVVASAVSVLPQLVAGAGVVLDDVEPAAVAAAILDIARSPDRYAELSRGATQTAARYTLDAWTNVIAARLTERWGPLRRGEVRSVGPS